MKLYSFLRFEEILLAHLKCPLGQYVNHSEAQNARNLYALMDDCLRKKKRFIILFLLENILALFTVLKENNAVVITERKEI